MTDDHILDDLFHGCAWAAFLDEAYAQQAWPDCEMTRRRAFSYFEAELAIKNGRSCQATTQQTSTPF